ncbi:MAG TPA: sigma factor, partial [Burkholderiaceae bacterium]|nr:sigma factor [Burkholderiaceae bacterium]
MNLQPPFDDAAQDARYRKAIAAFGTDIARFVKGYERDATRYQELLQEVHVALWQSFAGFKEQCSLRTWVYRVAHNVSASHVKRSLRTVERAELELQDAEFVVDEQADIEILDQR